MIDLAVGTFDIQLNTGDLIDRVDRHNREESAAAGCRFRDCRHEGEPGCAVGTALREGTLDVDRYESYLEQRRELAYQERRTNERARRAEVDRWRKITMNHRKRRRQDGTKP